MPQPKLLLIGNGGCQNRGCEAITLGTIEILRQAFGSDVSFVDMSYATYGTPPPQWASCHENYSYSPQLRNKRFQGKWWIQKALTVSPKIHQRFLNYQNNQRMLAHIDSATAILSLGGDNYTLDYGMPYTHINHGKFAKEHGIPFFIWGGSVGPFDKKPDFAQAILKHLRDEVTGIFTRETRSYDYLTKNQVKNTWMMSDPAFAMEPEPVSAEQLGFEMPEDAIGINLSPIMRNYCHEGDMAAWQKNAREIIQTVVKNFDNPILLVPHVTIGNHNNDHLFMQSCLEEIKRDKRIYTIDDRLNSRQTKWVISKLLCLVAARTHATIAAFSTCVPTVSLAYSVKAFGLNDMLFGHNDYLVPPDRLDPQSVLSVTKKVIQNAASIKNDLKGFVPNIKENAYRSGELLKQKIQGYQKLKGINTDSKNCDFSNTTPLSDQSTRKVG